MRKLTHRARSTGQTLKRTLNEVVARGLGQSVKSAPIDLPAFDMGSPFRPLDRAWQLDLDLEREEIRYEMERGD
ncbi:hypothetical protein [Salinispira pacifica]